MSALEIRPKKGSRWDLVALGEVMLRLDPGEQCVVSARMFRACEGGGEYNVARALANSFRLDTAVVTALADNAVGRLVESLIRAGGVDASLIRWIAYDGVGRAARNGLNFTERGFGLRPPRACPDRGHTAVSQLRPGELDWDFVFGRHGARWLHTGGIFAALSATTPAVAREAMEHARRHGAVISYDLNYRDSLWRDRGGRAAAAALDRELLPLADIAFGVDTGADPRSALARLASEFPNLRVIASTRRGVTSASRHSLQAVGWFGGTYLETRVRKDLDVLDRIGSGDAMAAGVAAGLLENRDPAWALDCGLALGALAMTTPGDGVEASREDLEAAMTGDGAGVRR